MGLDGIMAMVDEFDMNKRTGIDLPNEVLNMTPSRELKKRTQGENAEWKDIDTVYSSFGQVYDVITPIALLRTVAGVANGGKLYVPHLLKELKPVGKPGSPDYRASRVFQPLDPTRPNPKVLPIPEDIHHLVVEGMWGVVNNGGTGASIRMAGFDIAGKTGTAQVVGLGKDVGKTKTTRGLSPTPRPTNPGDCIGGFNRKLRLRRSARGARVRRVYDVITARHEMQNHPGRYRSAKTPKPENKTGETTRNANRAGQQRITVKAMKLRTNNQVFLMWFRAAHCRLPTAD